MTAPDRWRKPSRCGDSACVEVAYTKPSRCDSGTCVEVHPALAGGVLIRVSAMPDVLIAATADEWAAFRDAVKAGEYDDV